MPDVHEITRPLVLAVHVVMCREPDECVPNHPLQHQLTRHAYPGQPTTRTRPPTKPCTCYYHPYTWWGDWQLGSHFIVNPTCPHHAPELTIERLWNDPALNAMRDPYDLDDNERRF